MHETPRDDAAGPGPEERRARARRVGLLLGLIVLVLLLAPIVWKLLL